MQAGHPSLSPTLDPGGITNRPSYSHGQHRAARAACQGTGKNIRAPSFDFGARISDLASWLPHPEEQLRNVGAGREELEQRTIAGDVRRIDPVRRREVVILLHGVTLAAGRGEGEAEVLAAQLWRLNLHRHCAGDDQVNARIAIGQ